MANRQGDPAKRPPECNTEQHSTDCPHLKETNPTSLDGEQYECTVCGRAFYLDYDEMR